MCTPLEEGLSYVDIVKLIRYLNSSTIGLTKCLVTLTLSCTYDSTRVAVTIVLDNLLSRESNLTILPSCGPGLVVHTRARGWTVISFSHTILASSFWYEARRYNQFHYSHAHCPRVRNSTHVSGIYQWCSTFFWSTTPKYLFISMRRPLPTLYTVFI